MRGLYPLQPVRTLGVRLSHLLYKDTKQAAQGHMIQTQLVPVTPAPQLKPRKRKPVEEEDLFQSIMSHSILPSKKVGPGGGLQKRKCTVCNQEFMANEELAKVHVEECTRRASEGPQKRKPGLFTGLF